MSDYSYISSANAHYIDKLYKKYKTSPESLDESWRKFFEGFEFSLSYNQGKGSKEMPTKDIGVRNLIDAYRTKGHLKSDTNPIRPRRNHHIQLDPSEFGLDAKDLNRKFFIENGNSIVKTNTLQDTINNFKKAYLGPIGFEYMYIKDPEIVNWFKQKIEVEFLNFKFSIDEKKQILKKLNEAMVFENFLHTKYIGQKRFSLEGGENTIPFLDFVIKNSVKDSVEEIVIGMAHRGRLNVLANIMGKTYEQIFSEFEGTYMPDDLTMGSGDVKYHMGYASEFKVKNGKKYQLKLTPNPSHLEAVNPVVLGYARSHMESLFKRNPKKVLPILIHGDAAIAGQGITYEISQMSQLPGYRVGGTIHLVINNQIGFTTDYDDARTSIYCTDAAKIINAPVLHVNGDDAEAIAFSAKLAVEFKQKFGKDIFIDLLCYRRHGHNEGDEPKFTQPKLYKLISSHPPPREVYSKKLIANGDVEEALAVQMDKEFRNLLQERLNEVKQTPYPYTPDKLGQEWQQLAPPKTEDFEKSPNTSISEKAVQKVSKALTSLPEKFKPIRQISKLIDARKDYFFSKKMLDWASAELLAYGSLLLEKKLVRISGQDVKRGTFSHRHAVIFDAETKQAYCNLDHITSENKQEKLEIFNSLLSELSVLGFEYGYAMANPNALVIWEAQFGDFSNGAQVIIDQFVTSAQTKWQKMNGLVMLLPHGYEGQGPEHSSARPERFLQLAAENNMVVANMTTPANFFHLLRRQVTWKFRIPCIVMSPKSLLRHPEVISPISEFTNGHFCEVIGDETINPKDVTKVILCTGKIYYTLNKFRTEQKRKNVAIVRLEQLYPFPDKQLKKQLGKYKKNVELLWVQEEPENMGYVSFIQRHFKKITKFVSRKPSASPSTGYKKVHIKEEIEIIQQTFN